MNLILFIVLQALSTVCITYARSDQKFQLDQHLKHNKELSPTLAGFLKRGEFEQRSASSSSPSFENSKLRPPATKTRENAAKVGTYKAMQANGQLLTGAKEVEQNMKLAEINADALENGSIKTSKIPGDVFYFFGTLLNIEYATCVDGRLENDLSDEQDNHLVSVRGFALGECNPYESPSGASYELTVTENIFLETLIVHQVTYEYSNCSGANVTTHTLYPGPEVCVGDIKQFVTTSLTLHELFPRLADQLYVLPVTETCDVRKDILYFLLHNISYNHFNSDMCWTYDHYTLSIQEGAVYDPRLETTIVTKEFEPFDDKKCRRDAVSIEGWVVNRCEPLTEYTGMKAVWTSIGAKDNIFYIGVQGYDTYDCDRNKSMTGTTILNMKVSDSCYHNVPVPWMIHEDPMASWADYGLDSHSEYYGGQICNEEHLFMWKTAETECDRDTKTDFSQCLTYNHYAVDDQDDIVTDEFAVELKSQEIFCHVSESSDSVCFHIDSTIDYKGKEYSYQELLNGSVPECSVPHSPRSVGVIVTTSCDKTLRVTDTHLVATSKGFQLAFSLKEGDVLFGSYSNSDQCVVKSVTKESSPQQYFGLNCVHSEVLASGIRTSTFGDFHTLPSWYMTYVGSIIGNDYASRLGDYIVAEWYRV
eukprot:CAMPEP_0114428388 /NCGR_PEP_ID=MMETSP0103-20121206/8897_1 /TAXON_ID=37642 ORGANISM="Paraphysomonas imperforata, Strain PA2" /NCGR_SAMPLE_ID=MMETSP0103 /ASSEMBLY_ACC=CAM_ASM_000201 /LENGTH=646 /DNA_ID=CAMNT_0001597597 /DNA_START=131 /DNA_END=2071 /DNA_ORIENTATION=+